MTSTDKTHVRLVFGTRAMIAALTRYEELNPGECITKSRLFPNVIRRASQLMDEEYDETFDEDAIPPPDEKFLFNHMGEIRELAASGKYKKYIIWNPPHHQGIRLGTFVEFQEIPCPKLIGIVKGIKDTVDKLGHIINQQGGTTVSFTFEQKQIGSGNNDEQPNNG